jgi:hypothetical protein
MGRWALSRLEVLAIRKEILQDTYQLRTVSGQFDISRIRNDI